jgi:hypothetical protein
MSDDLSEFLAARKIGQSATPATSRPEPAQRQDAPQTAAGGDGPTGDDLLEFLAAQEAGKPVAPSTPPRSLADVRAEIEEVKRRVRTARVARPL